MRRIISIGVLALFIMLVVSSLSVGARETVTITAGTVDFEYTIADDSELAYSYTVELPCELVDLVGMTDPMFNITNTGTVLNYTITVNDEDIWYHAEISAPGSQTHSAQDLADFMADNTTTELVINISCNNTNNEITLYFVGDDVDVTSAQLASHFAYVESDETPLMVKELGKNRWTVNDTVNGTNDLGYDLTDCNLTLDYPSSASADHDEVYLTGDITDGTSTEFYVVYQKDSPYYDPDEDITTGSVVITVHANSYEDLDDAGWELDPSDYALFNGLDDTDDLTITKDDNELDEDDDWEWDDDIIVFADELDFEEDEEYVFEFSWAGAPSGAVTPPEETAPTTEPFYNQPVMGIPLWAIIAVIVIVVAILFIASKKK